MRNQGFAFQIRTVLIFATLLLGIIALSACSSSPMTTQIKIEVVGDDVEEWRPTTVSVRTGGTVTWLNTGNEIHTVISRDGLWSEKRLTTGQSFNHTFTKSGTYTYANDPDTQIGTVIVR